jgi:hypothetical protein
MTREETNNKNKTSVQNTTFCNDLSLSFEDEYVAELLCVYRRPEIMQELGHGTMDNYYCSADCSLIIPSL